MKNNFFNVWQIFSEAEHRRLKLMVFLLLVNSLLELSGLILVIPYVNIMVSEQYFSDLIQKWPYIISFSKLTGDYKIDVTLLFVSFYILKNLLLGAITFHVHTIQKQLQANIESRMFQKILKQPYQEFIKKILRMKYVKSHMIV